MATRTTPSPLDEARAKYLMFDAALEKLRRQIDETKDPAELAALQDKVLALNLAINDVRQQIETMEALEKQKRPKPQ